VGNKKAELLARPVGLGTSALRLIPERQRGKRMAETTFLCTSPIMGTDADIRENTDATSVFTGVEHFRFLDNT
jgi:hypothetical protein